MDVWTRKLEYPINIKNPNPALAKFIISQVGGPDGELLLRKISVLVTPCHLTKPLQR